MATRSPSQAKYQLVLQFPAEAEDDFDAIVAIEDKLTEGLDDGSDVEGHEFGTGTANVFIETTDPEATFEAVLALLAKQKRPKLAVAASRAAEGGDYTVLWPSDYDQDFDTQ